MYERNLNTPQTGDKVKHHPTGETWTVALVRGDDLYWCGWPEGYADVGDCTLLQKATMKERIDLLRRLSKLKGHDSRGYYARGLLDMLGEQSEVT